MLDIWFCRIFRPNLRQNSKYMVSESIESKILSSIKKCGRGNLLFASDFIRYGEPKSVNKALERMMKEGSIMRISHGIYYYPKIDKVLGLGVLYPTLEDIAEAVAKRDKARIVPTGLYALNRLGFSTQIPMNVMYLTDSFNRKIKLYNGTSIQFKRTSPKNIEEGRVLQAIRTLSYRLKKALLRRVPCMELGEGAWS